jgi:predicted component of type VI protein secretion system
LSRKLIVNDGRRERELLLIGKIVVGRDPLCDISDADALLSRRHAEFQSSGDGVIVRDLGSRNGIFVNGARVAEGALRSGDIVQIGHLQLRFVEDSAPLTSAPEMNDGEATAVLHPPVNTSAPAAGNSAIRPPVTPAPAPAPALPASVAAAPVQAEDESEIDRTSLVPPPGLSQILRSGSGSTPPVPLSPPTDPSASNPGFTPDENDQTRVVSPPELRAAIHMAMSHPAPSPAQAAAEVYGRPGADGGAADSAARPAPPMPSGSSVSRPLATVPDGTSIVPAPPGMPTPVTPPPPRAAAPQAAMPPAPAAAAVSAAPTSAAAPAAPSQAPAVQGTPAAAGATAPWQAFVQTRIGLVAGATVVSALLFPALGLGTMEGGVLAIAVAGVAAFVVSAMVVERANQAAKALKQDLDLALEGKVDKIGDPLGTGPSKDLADALTGLAARVRAAEGRR